MELQGIVGRREAFVPPHRAFTVAPATDEAPLPLDQCELGAAPAAKPSPTEPPPPAVPKGPTCQLAAAPKTLDWQEPPKVSRRPILLFEDCHAVLKGTAGHGMSDRVRDGLLHRLEVHRRNAGTLPREVEALRARLADDPAATREVFGQLKHEHPQLLAQHMVFANVDQVCDWLDMRPSDGVERVRKAVVVGGVHGNELSGMAVAGTIHDEHPESRVRTFSNGNPWAGMMISRRNLGEDGQSVDMNRIFPGDPNGTPEQQRAAEICSAAQQAGLAIDLHEGLAEWDQGRAGRLCIFHPTPQSLAFLKAFEPVLREHDFRLVPYRYDGTLVQEAGKGGAGVSLLFELPLSLDFEARTELGTKLVRSALHLGFHPPTQ